MERRLRGRGKRDEVEPSSPVQLPVNKRVTTASVASSGPATRTRGTASPARTRGTVSPSRNKAAPTEEIRTRRSSRPRSTTFGMPAVVAPNSRIKPPTPIKEIIQEVKIIRNSSSLPTTLTTNTSSRAPNKSFTTSSVHSSYSSTTQRTVEIRSTDLIDEESISKRLADRLRRSLSKSFTNATSTGTERTHTPTTNSDAESRYSRSVSRSVYDDDKSSKATHSESEDENDNEEEEDLKFCSFNATQTSISSPSVCRKVKAPREFGGWLGVTFLVLSVPVIVYYLQWSCSGVRNACAFKPFNFGVLTDVQYLTRQIFKPTVVGAYLAFQLGIFVLTALLPGRRVHLTRETYKFNSLSMALFVLTAAGIGEYLRYPVVDFIVRHYLRFCIYGILNAITVAFWCYIRVDKVKYNVLRQTLSNDYGKSDNFLVDYALGRQLNPKWLGLVDFKQVFYRTYLVSTLIFACCFIYKTVQVPQLPEETADIANVAKDYIKNINYEPATLLSASMLLLYISDAILFEHHLASSFELQHEGFGCLLLLRYASTPYILSATAKYFHDHRVPITCNFAFITAGALLLLGLAIKRYSCAFKYKYRLNPQNAIFANVETIHTFQSSRLLLSGLWGHLRQPNYLGDIIALLSLSVPLFLRFVWPPLISLLLLIAMILHRATRANARNQARYHSSWSRYCARVPHYVLPKIF